MTTDPTPAYMHCAMDAHEQGARPEDIAEECCCRRHRAADVSPSIQPLNH